MHEKMQTLLFNLAKDSYCEEKKMLVNTLHFLAMKKVDRVDVQI
jgi:hypothetical protein